MTMEEGEIDIDPQEQVKNDSNSLLTEQAKMLGEATQENKGLKEILAKCNEQFKAILVAFGRIDTGMRQKDYYDVGVIAQNTATRLNDIVKQLDSILGIKKEE